MIREPPQHKRCSSLSISILSSIHFSSILSAKTCANVAKSDHFGPSFCLVQIQAASQVITETSLTEKHNTAHLSRTLRCAQDGSSKKRKKSYSWHLNKFSLSTSNLGHSCSMLQHLPLPAKLCKSLACRKSKLSIGLPVPFPPASYKVQLTSSRMTLGLK